MSFTPDEIDYLASQPLARFATVASDGHPDVMPVAFEFDGSGFWVGGSGESVLVTRKIRNVLDGNRDVALVVDDLVSFDPFIARGGPHLRVGVGSSRTGRPRRPRQLHAHHPQDLVELEPERPPGRRHLVRSPTH